MTSSAMQDFLSDVLGSGRIPGGKLAYFQTRLAGTVHQAVLKIFGRLERQRNFTRRELAQRIGRKPEQITRWFSYPGNLTLGTLSDLLVGMGYELESITLTDLVTGRRIQCPDHGVDWARLAALYGQEQAYVATSESPQSALGNQSARQDLSAARPAVDQPAQRIAWREWLPMSSVPGKAATAQLQATGLHRRTQIGEPA